MNQNYGIMVKTSHLANIIKQSCNLYIYIFMYVGRPGLVVTNKHFKGFLSDRNFFMPKGPHISPADNQCIINCPAYYMFVA